MKYYLLILIFLLSCGQNNTSLSDTKYPSCTISGQTISCPDGSSLTVDNITPVKLCTDDSTPFPEYGFKLNGKLYGVYWDPNKGAFWALITPGNYMSTNGTGCHFTLNQDGTVIQ